MLSYHGKQRHMQNSFSLVAPLQHPPKVASDYCSKSWSTSKNGFSKVVPAAAGATALISTLPISRAIRLVSSQLYPCPPHRSSLVNLSGHSTGNSGWKWGGNVRGTQSPRLLGNSKVRESHHPRGTTLREALWGICLSEGVSLRGSAGLCEVLQGSTEVSECSDPMFRVTAELLEEIWGHSFMERNRNS